MFERILEKRSDDTENKSFDWTAFVNNTGILPNNRNKDLYYCKCINVLGETVARIPLEIKKDTNNGRIIDEKHYLNNVLRLRPNLSMTIFELIKNFVMVAKDSGQAGIFIKRDNKGLISGLYPVKINAITIDNVGIIESTKNNKVLIDFSLDNYVGTCFEKDMIIFRDNNINVLQGKSSRSYINNAIDSNVEAQRYQANLFKNGLTNKAVLQLTSDIKDESQLKAIKKKFARIFNDDIDSTDKILPVPAGYSLTPLNLSLADSQFAELKLQGKQDICNAIGIPIKLLDGTITEDEMNSFYNNTVNTFLVQLEQEMNYKLLSENERLRGYKIRFNVSAVLKTSLEKQKNILIDYVKNGVYTTNDVRDILGVQRVEGGDILLYPSGQITLENLIKGQATWQKDNINSDVKGGDNDE